MTEKELFDFHEKEVRVTCKDGTSKEGMIWAYSETEDEEEGGPGEAYISFGGLCIYASEIAKIERV